MTQKIMDLEARSALEAEENAAAAAHAELPVDDSPGAPPGFDQTQYVINMAKMTEQLEAMAAELRKSQSENAKWKSICARRDGADAGEDAGAASFHPMTPQNAEGAGGPGRRQSRASRSSSRRSRRSSSLSNRRHRPHRHPPTTPKSFGDWGHGTAGGAAPHADPWGAQPDPWTKSNGQRKDAGQSGGSQSEGNLQTAPERQERNL